MDRIDAMKVFVVALDEGGLAGATRKLGRSAAAIIASSPAGPDSWSFPPGEGAALSRTAQFTPRVVVNSVRAAVASVVYGRGVTRLLSYQVADNVRNGRLQIELRSYEPAPLPVHVIMPAGRPSVPKVRVL